jgi:hypothetical protein
MTNPKNKKTHEEFEKELKNKHPTIMLLENYINTDTKLRYKCDHGENSARPWQLLTMKHCCRKGYYSSGVMWDKRTLTLEQVKEKALKTRKNIDVSECYIETEKYKKILNIKCTVHNVYYSSYVKGKIGLCPKCNEERNLAQLAVAMPLAWASQKNGSFVSKKETKWLDSLGIENRQVWLEDVKYKVDGYDPNTNTVYLYHGKFWHGCPETFDPEMIHPVVKIPMKDLYQKTLFYERKIKSAGYNLIIKWEE